VNDGFGNSQFTFSFTMRRFQIFLLWSTIVVRVLARANQSGRMVVRNAHSKFSRFVSATLATLGPSK
jgi:hypothetical protein